MEKETCPVCNKTAESDVAGEFWIECSSCLQWLHKHCIGLDSLPPDEELWFCSKCSEKAAKQTELIEKQNGGDDASSIVSESNKTIVNNVSVDAMENQISMLADVIRDREEVLQLKLKQLNLMEKLSQTSERQNVQKWVADQNASHEVKRNTKSYNWRQPSGPENVMETVVQNKSRIGDQKKPICERPRKPLSNACKSDVTCSSQNEIRGTGDSEVMSLMKKQMQLMCRQYLEELPEFAGDPKLWPIFYRQYTDTTREGGFDDGHNLCRLRKCLKGEARDAVKGVLSLPNSLADVIRILKHRFGRIDILIRQKLKLLKDIMPPNESKPTTVIKFQEFLQDLNATLINADAANYLNSPQTLDAVIEKLPPGIAKSWIRHKRNNASPILADFIEWFDVYYECALLTDRDTQTRPEMSKESTKRNHSRINVHNESDSVQNTSEKLVQCHFCRKMKHVMTDCRSFRDLQHFKKWRFVRQKGLCFVCLLSKHRYENCEKKKDCGVSGCKEPHNSILHKDDNISAQKIDKKSDESTSSKHLYGNNEIVSTQSENGNRTYFRVLPVTLHNPTNNKSVETWAFLDEGSSPTMLSNKLADELQVDGIKDELCTTWTDSSVRKDADSKRVIIEISGVNSSKKFTLHNVRTVTQLSLPMPELDIENLKTKYDHLKGVNIPKIPLSRPGILIGLEHSKLGIMYEVKEGKWNEPIASRTRLGWAIHGKEVDGGPSELYSCHQCECQGDEELHDSLRDFFTTEAFGVKCTDNELESKEMERSREMLRDTTKKIGSQYETGLLWKADNIVLPNNKSMAMKRLICFEQKLNRNIDLKAAVTNKMSSHIENGYLQKLSADELDNLGERQWYLPVFSITNANKPGKLRLVFDAAAKFKGMSLNDALLKGPDQLASLFGVLLRFREGQIGIAADIAEMFHRVKIIPQDQNSQLILWRDADHNRTPDTYRMRVMTFGATCSPSSAQFVKNTNAALYRESHPRAVESIVRRHYVDDLLDSVSNEQDALQLAKDVEYIHAQGGFKIRNWISNSRLVAESMNHDVSSGNKDVDLNMSEEIIVEKVLGMYWRTETDEFIYKINLHKIDASIIEMSRVPSKREVLRLIMSLFDPLGLLSIVTLCAKLIMQDIWRSGIHWDTEIPDEIVPRWHRWLTALNQVETLRAPRCYSSYIHSASQIDLHLFSDASEDSFAVAAYLRVKTKTGNVEVQLIAAKTRVAPTKGLSINRMELQGCVMATRMKDTLKRELSIPIVGVTCWTDSQTALAWIRSIKRKYSPFVSHRIGEILDSTNVDEWRWVPGPENVADDVTRWRDDVSVSARWFTGPSFLKNESDEWPTEKVRATTTEEEVKAVNVHRQRRTDYKMLKPDNFSKWERLLRSTAYVVQYIRILRSRVSSKKSPLKVTNTKVGITEMIRNAPALQSCDLNRAEQLLFKKAQEETYDDDIISLECNGKVQRNSKIYNLNPFLDENGVIKLLTRLDVAPPFVSEEMRHPVLLSHQHRITQLVIDAIHRKFYHHGRESVINDLRQRLWIPKARVAVNSVISKCNWCIIRKAKPIIPKMANLPAQRIAPFQPAFTCTGMDFFGPIEITSGRRREKRWGVIFTCLTSRAVHLELASTLDTSSAIMCIRNFMNRRGCPAEMFSDNGTNLRAAEKELRFAVENLDMERIRDGIANLTPNELNRTKWTFIPPRGSHFGGIWERMIRTVKTSLYTILKAQAPREETLRSALIEVENIVNSRPLTYTAADIESPEAITPNHLLRGKCREVPQLTGEYDCRRQWRIAQALANDFWKRWLQEYLPTISHRTKWNSDTEALKVGQIVLVVDDNLPRNEWRRAVVTEVYTSGDKRVRSAQVKTAKGSYVRPVSKLAVINITNTDSF